MHQYHVKIDGAIYKTLNQFRTKTEANKYADLARSTGKFQSVRVKEYDTFKPKSWIVCGRV